jgi:hypothetical protein
MRIGQRMVMDDFCHVEELLSGKVWAALREGSEGFGIQGASRRARIDAEILKRLADRPLYPLPQQALTRKGVKAPGRSRPAFVHELFREFGQKRLALDQTLTLTPVYPLRLTVDWPSIDHSKPSVIEEFSPFLDVSDFKLGIMRDRFRKVFGHERSLAHYLVFDGKQHEGYPSDYEPIRNLISENSTLLFVKMPPAEPEWGLYGSSNWEMGFAIGPRLHQSIEAIEGEAIWAWHNTQVINIQILNAVTFEAMTGLKTPTSPISWQRLCQGWPSPVLGLAISQGSEP